MAELRRYFVRAPDGGAIAGYDNPETAEYVAHQYGDGAHLVDTLAEAYHPMVQEVQDGKLVFLPLGGWDTGRFGVDRDLIMGIKKGHVAIVHAFLAKGADANARDDNGAPAVLWAVASDRPEVLRLLLVHGADTAARDADGTSALDLARRRAAAAMVEVLDGSAGPD
jgi:hypothetical protein